MNTGSKKGAARDAKLNASLRQVMVDPFCTEAPEVIRSVLQSCDFTAIKTCADLIRDNLLSEYEDGVTGALERLMKLEYKADPGCLAKIALGDALYHLNAGSPPMWRKLICYVQKEPVWGKSIDTAAELRGCAALALVATGDAEAVFDVVHLLSDVEAQARCAAARALGQLGSLAAELVLRFKADTGDREPGVTAEVLDALARAVPERSVEFITPFLTSEEDQVREGAALALAQTHLPEAYSAVCGAWEANPFARRSLLRGIAQFRTDKAFELLLGSINSEDIRTASAAISALAIYGAEAKKVAAIQQCVQSRSDAKLLQRYHAVFGEEQ